MQTRSTTCPRCGESFTCGVGTIGSCQCAAIVLTELQRAYIRTQFTDCLCVACLKAIQETLQDQEKA